MASVHRRPFIRATRYRNFGVERSGLSPISAKTMRYGMICAKVGTHSMIGVAKSLSGILFQALRACLRPCGLSGTLRMAHPLGIWLEIEPAIQTSADKRVSL